MKPVRSTLHECREHVMARKEFKGSNIWGEWHGDKRYIVYSYGYHFPMWVYESATGQWYGNKDKYSRSTSKHQTMSRPYIPDGGMIWFDAYDMRVIADYGYTGLVYRRLTGKRAA